MRAYANGRVAVSTRDIDEFCGRFPCSGLRGLRGVTFTFEGTDLVDIHYRNGSSDRWDGQGLVALSQAAQEYGEKVWAIVRGAPR